MSKTDNRFYGENWFCWALAALGTVGSFALVNFSPTSQTNSLLEAAQRLAFINAGFIVAAFNLRFRLLDLISKDWFSVSEFETLSVIMSECTERINRQIIFHVITSAAMAAAPLAGSLPSPSPLIFVMLAFGLFSLGVGRFLQVLSSFARLEKLSRSAVQRSLQRKKIESDSKLFEAEVKPEGLP